MTNTTTASPATTGKTAAQPFGFPLRLFAFKKTIAKAQALKPCVTWLSLSGSNVRSSDGNTDFLVRFYNCNDELYAACSCYAAWKAQPCYHIAAAAIDRKMLMHSIDQVAAIEEKPIHLEIVDDDAEPDRFRPQPTTDHREARESFSYDMRQVRAQADRLKRETGWDL